MRILNVKNNSCYQTRVNLQIALYHVLTITRFCSDKVFMFQEQRDLSAPVVYKVVRVEQIA